MEGPFAISGLPPEVLEHILNLITTPHFLSLRLVSRIWDETVARLSRRRLQKMNTQNCKSLDEISSTFEKSTHPPIASIEFNVLTLAKYGPTYISMLHDITWNCGQYIQSLTLVGYNLDLLLEFLQYTPILKHLSHSPSLDDKGKDGHALETNDLNMVQRNLRALNILQFNILCKKYLDTFKTLVTSSRHLDAVDVNASSREARQIWSEIPPIIFKVPKITLRILSHTVVEDLSPFHELKIYELWINIPSSTHNGMIFYDNLERFLKQISCSLQNLSIVHYVDFGKLPIRAQVRLPILKNLKMLSVFENRVTDVAFQSPSLMYIEQFGAETFPALEKFHFVTNGGVFHSLSAVVFDSVRELDVKLQNFNGNFAENDWHKIFPNLRKLATRANVESFQYIVTRLSALEELDISINLKYECPHTGVNIFCPELNINKVLSGFRDPQTIYFQKQPFPHPKHPSLLSLYGLKKLKLDCRDAGALSEAGVTLSLLRIRPLQNLIIENGELSDTSTFFLERHHLQFLCLRNNKCSDRVLQ